MPGVVKGVELTQVFTQGFEPMTLPRQRFSKAARNDIEKI
jgi:hypothetical protein